MWIKVIHVDIDSCHLSTHKQLSDITVPATMYCNNVLCKDENHRHCINNIIITFVLLYLSKANIMSKLVVLYFYLY